MAVKNRKSLWGFSAQSLLVQSLSPKALGAKRVARVRVQGGKTLGPMKIIEAESEVDIVISPFASAEPEKDPQLKTSAFARIRDAVGAGLTQLERLDVEWAEFDLDLNSEGVRAALLGLEIGLYRFKRVYKGDELKLRLHLKQKGKALADKVVQEAVNLGVGVNLARHFTNLPPNLLNPSTYAEAVRTLFSGIKNVRVEVWDEKTLAKEKMGLMLSVGGASGTPPRLVKISYRPGVRKAPVAFVGKGVTFDSGGLDIKPASGMRLMKKDMGGSAAVLGLFYWAVASKLKRPLDAYLALAENSIGSESFRPSDIVTSRSGLQVEIHNTDAEGRLILADAMDVAVTAKDKPSHLIDVATLTGAIKSALGAGLAGLFSNDKRLAERIAKSCQAAGDPVWIMPLVQKYRSQLNSNFADMVNCSDGFGGAITAALFLEKFAGDLPWAHLDIYAWKDSAEGAWLESGGSGQAVLGLAEWLGS